MKTRGPTRWSVIAPGSPAREHCNEISLGNAGDDGRSRQRRRDIDVDQSATAAEDRKSVVSGKSVSVRVDLGGGRIIQNNKKEQHISIYSHEPTQVFLHTTDRQINI